MYLKTELFETVLDLCLFVNKRKISKENIQAITTKSSGFGYALFWWE